MKDKDKDHETTVPAQPQLEDLVSVGTRVSWGAILAGTFMALGVFFLLATLGGAVGLSTSDRADPTTLQTGAIIWAFVTTIAALFIGGLVTSLYTAGENKTEAVMSGLVTWAVLFAALLVLGGLGVRSGFSAMLAISNNAQVASNWETSAKEAGVSQQQIDEWRRTNTGAADPAAQNARRQEILNAATRIGWYAFLGTWVSMLAAAAGAFVGAGPTFRLVGIGVRPVARIGAPSRPPAGPGLVRA